MQTVKLSELVFDFDLYPRGDVDSQHVHYMRESLQAGVKLPPMIVDKKSKRVVDGFHRGRAYKAEQGDDAIVEVVLKTYHSEAAMFEDAMRFNSAHGRALNSFDKSKCIIRAELLGLTVEQTAAALCLTCEAVGKLRTGRVGKLRATSVKGELQAAEEIPLKRTIAHMAGMTLTRGQVEANGKLGGMNQAFYANQLITLIESNLLDKEDEKLIERLRVLHGLLETLLVAV